MESEKNTVPIPFGQQCGNPSEKNHAMIGLLFHGSDVFDRGWAMRFAREFPNNRLMLAGRLSRTALLDCGLQSVETPELPLSECLQVLASSCSQLVLVTCSKSLESGLALGQMVADKARLKIPLVQTECCNRIYIQLSGESSTSVLATINALGFRPMETTPTRINLWQKGDTLYRRISATDAGDYVLVNGIFIGKAQGGEVVLGARGRDLTEIHGVNVKAHGLEKIKQLGGVNLATAKLAPTLRLRSSAANPRMDPSNGSGVAFIDHAGTHIYISAHECAAAVTVGDDTTAIAADVLRRFGLPVIGIVDGDSDNLHPNGGFAAGSTVLTVKDDDDAGELIREAIFHENNRCTLPLAEVKDKVFALLKPDIIKRIDY